MHTSSKSLIENLFEYSRTLGWKQDLVWLAGVLFGWGMLAGAVLVPPYPENPGGVVFAYASVLMRSALYVGCSLFGGGGCRIFGRLWAMGLVAGFLEILVEYPLAAGWFAGRLVYLGGMEWRILETPLYMPFAWACVIVDGCYLAARAFGWSGRKMHFSQASMIASIASGLFAFGSVGLYELFGYRAGWWMYEEATLMFAGNLVVFIPVAEFLMFAAGALAASALALGRTLNPVVGILLAGAVFGVAIGAGSGLAYLLFEVLPRALV